MVFGMILIVRRVWRWTHHKKLLWQYSACSGPRDQPIAGLYENLKTRKWVSITEPPAPGQRIWKTKDWGNVDSDRIKLIFDGPTEAGYRH